MQRHLAQRHVHHALLVVLAVAIVAAVAVPWANRQAPAPAAPATPPVVTCTERDDATRVEIAIAAYGIADVAGGWSRVTLPGCAPLQEAGYPEVPVVPVTLLIPGAGEPRLEVVAVETRDLSIAPVVPSLGHLSREVDPAALTPQAAPFYGSNAVWPADAVVLGDPFAIRHRRGVTVTVFPVRWDAGRGVAVAITRLELAVRCVGDGGRNPVATDKASADDLYADIYAGLFANAGADKGAGLQAPLASHRMLIVCGNGLTGAVQPFASWKRQRGLEVELVTYEEVGGTELGLRQAIAGRYHATSGLAYLILVGDVDQVPTGHGTFQGAASDGTYATIEGDDLYADFLVSRLPARNADEAASMVAKIIAYERDPQLGEPWYGRAIGIASDEGSPSDRQRAEWLRDDLLAFGFSDVSRIYQGLGGTTAGITAAVNAGAGLINYLGHGTATSWNSVPFSSGDVRALTNGRRQPWIVDVSCSTGDFTRDECFAEAWLRAGTAAAPAGAVGMIAASTATPWVPPCVMQAEIVDRLVADDTLELGSLFVTGIARVLTVYSGLSVAQQVAEQYNLFGDCSLVVRKRIPRTMSVEHAGAILPAAETWTVRVAGADQPMVTLTTADDLVARATVAADGSAALAFARPARAGEVFTLTVTAPDAAPVVAEVPVRAEAVPVAEPVFAGPRIVGNAPNPCNPRTTILMELPSAGPVSLRIYDIRGNLVRDLVHDAMPAGRQAVAWDGADGAGRAQASGTYFARLMAAGVVSTHALTVVR